MPICYVQCYTDEEKQFCTITNRYIRYWFNKNQFSKSLSWGSKCSRKQPRLQQSVVYTSLCRNQLIPTTLLKTLTVTSSLSIRGLIEVSFLSQLIVNNLVYNFSGKIHCEYSDHDYSTFITLVIYIHLLFRNIQKCSQQLMAIHVYKYMCQMVLQFPTPSPKVDFHQSFQK